MLLIDPINHRLAAMYVESTYIQIKNGFAMIEPWDARAKKNMLSKVAEGGILVMINLRANVNIQVLPPPYDIISLIKQIGGAVCLR